MNAIHSDRNRDELERVTGRELDETSYSAEIRTAMHIASFVGFHSFIHCSPWHAADGGFCFRRSLTSGGSLPRSTAGQASDYDCMDIDRHRESRGRRVKVGGTNNWKDPQKH